MYIRFVEATLITPEDINLRHVILWPLFPDLLRRHSPGPVFLQGCCEMAAISASRSTSCFPAEAYWP